ncbi:hypothetical protein ACB092_06G059600 [Castanea dentata]
MFHHPCVPGLQLLERLPLPEQGEHWNNNLLGDILGLYLRQS